MSIGANLKPDENGNWGAVGIKNSSTGNELYVNADGSINVSGGGGGGGGGGGAIVSNGSDGVTTTLTNQAVASYGYGFNGTTWDRLQVDASKNLKVAVQGTPNVAVTSMPTTTVTGSVGVSSFPTSGNSDGLVASTVGTTGLLGYNGSTTSWDRLQVDSNKNLKVLTTQGAVDSTALKQLTFQTAATALGAVTVDISGYNTISLDIIVTNTATVQFNVSNDGTNFTLIQFQTPQNTTPSATSVGATTRGLRFNVSGFKYFQSNISAYTSGSVTVSGYASTGHTPQSLYTLSASGGLVVTPRTGGGTNFTAIGDTPGNDGVTGTAVAASGLMGYNGATYDKVRVGKLYKYIEFLNLTAGSNATIWTPTASKKFRLIGIAVSTALTAGTFKILDNTTEFYTFSTAVTNGYGTFDFGNGYLSAAANNIMYIKNNNASTAHIWVTAWGTEE